MKILHVIPGMADSSGPTGALRSLAESQASAGNEVSIAYVTGRGADARESFVAGCELLGFRAEWLRHWAYSPGLRRWCREKVGHYDVAHIHSMWLYPNLAASREARRHDVPYWIRPAGSLDSWCVGHKALRKRMYFTMLERRVMSGAAAVHVVSEPEVLGVRSTGYKGRIVHIPHGVDVSAYSPDLARAEARAYFGLREGGPWLVYVGRIHPVKGLTLLGQVLVRLREQWPDVRLAVVGPDRHLYARELKAALVEMGISDAVDFLGERTAREKAIAFRIGDLFVLPSQSENFGMVVAEALASGTPVVVSDRTPWRHLNDLAIGRCCSLDAGTFAAEIMQVLGDQSRIDGMASRGLTYVRERHDWSKIADRMARSYRGDPEDDR